ncbi:MAG: sucrose phosphorylase [bacterium]
MSIKNKCQLITYPDSLGKNFQELHWVLRKYLKDAIGGVHILPFYPSSADRGFSPITYDQVDPEFGNWDDVEKIGEDFEIMVDFMVNHISQKSKFFQDYIEKGNDSEFADMFLSLKKFNPSGELSDDELAKIYTRKPRPPYFELERPDGSKEKVWCTFDYEQIDVDIDSPVTKDVFRNFLIFLCRHKAKLIRMDAFAYVTKELGTNCFFLEPKVWQVLEWLNKYVTAFDAEILPEIHEHYTIQQKIAQKGYRVYDFALPMLCLQAIYSHDSKNLKNWLSICPRKQITTLDTHDGIGIVDVAGLMTQKEIDTTVEALYAKGANVNKRYSIDPEYQNLDIYQINCTYYSALGDNDDAYITARVIQMFTPGIPQIYYVGLLAGSNDIELLEKTKLGRNINRHNYTLDEIERDFQKPVVHRLLELMKFRNECEAFDGELEILDSANDKLSLKWSKDSYFAHAEIDLTARKSTISYTDKQGKTVKFNT